MHYVNKTIKRASTPKIELYYFFVYNYSNSSIINSYFSVNNYILFYGKLLIMEISIQRFHFFLRYITLKKSITYIKMVL